MTNPTTSPVSDEDILAKIDAADGALIDLVAKETEHFFAKGMPGVDIGRIAALASRLTQDHMKAQEQAADHSPDEVAGQDIMIGEFIARWEEAADGVMMDADTAQALAQAFRDMRSRPTGKAIMDEIDKDPEISTDAAIRVYAAIKRAALSNEVLQPSSAMVERVERDIEAAMICLAKRAEEIGTHPPTWRELAKEAALAALTGGRS